MDGVVGSVLGAFVVPVLVVGVIRFVNDLRRRHPDRPPSDTTVDMATGEVAGQSIAAAIAAFLEQLF